MKLTLMVECYVALNACLKDTTLLRFQLIRIMVIRIQNLTLGQSTFHYLVTGEGLDTYIIVLF